MARYYMMNKPRGYISACSDAQKDTVLDIFPKEEREGLFHVGRLDRDTEGLLLFTDDGRLCFDLLNPENEIPKTYLSYVLGEVDEKRLKEVEAGVNIYKGSDKVTAPAKIESVLVSTLANIRNLLSGRDVSFARGRPDFPVTLVRITITEGKKHQVKRMMRYMGNRVLYLKRLSFASLMLDEGLALGEYRPLTDEEINQLRQGMHI